MLLARCISSCRGRSRVRVPTNTCIREGSAQLRQILLFLVGEEKQLETVYTRLKAQFATDFRLSRSNILLPADVSTPQFLVPD